MDRQQAAAKLAELRKHADKKNSGAKKSNGDAKVDAEIARLAALSPVEYEQQRKDAAEQLGMRASILDKLVRAERPDDDNKQGGAIDLPEPEPWPEPVNGALLLSNIADAIRDYVVMSDAARDTTALWSLHSYLLDQSLVTPRLAISSPEKRCGKTTLLDVARPLGAQAIADSERHVGRHLPGGGGTLPEFTDRRGRYLSERKKRQRRAARRRQFRTSQGRLGAAHCR
jgi:putative DNA primase/helicase